MEARDTTEIISEVLDTESFSDLHSNTESFAFLAPRTNSVLRQQKMALAYEEENATRLLTARGEARGEETSSIAADSVPVVSGGYGTIDLSTDVIRPFGAPTDRVLYSI